MRRCREKEIPAWRYVGLARVGQLGGANGFGSSWRHYYADRFAAAALLGGGYYRGTPMGTARQGAESGGQPEAKAVTAMNGIAHGMAAGAGPERGLPAQGLRLTEPPGDRAGGRRGARSRPGRRGTGLAIRGGSHRANRTAVTVTVRDGRLAQPEGPAHRPMPGQLQFPGVDRVQPHRGRPPPYPAHNPASDRACRAAGAGGRAGRRRSRWLASIPAASRDRAPPRGVTGYGRVPTAASKESTLFVTYRRRELYRRMRQTAPIAGPGAGAGLVITVSAVSVGLRDAQNTVLRALYGVGSELTVTQTPSGGPPSPSPSLPPPAGTRGSSGPEPPEGTSFRQDSQFSRQLGPLPASSVVSIARLPGVRAVAAGLTLTDRRVSAAAGGREEPGPSRRPAPISTRIFGVSGVDPARPGIGPLSSARISAGRAFTAADAGASVALLDSAYANQQPRAAGSTITVAGAALKVIGIVGLREGSAPSDVCIPLQGRSAWPAWRTR